ncbi:MAG: DUF933 domain-containing protein [Candidatus Omnitrophica bacterium]|nr:DUF933 domain-containing protein [Candidatus Omnitrophota bacterium]
MKIFNLGLDLEPGKQVYKSSCFEKLVEKFSPKKSTPYPVEFVDSDIDQSEAIVLAESKRLDLIVTDLEKIETRLSRCESEAEKLLFKKAQVALEAEELLCDLNLSDSEKTLLKTLPLLTFKPCLVKNEVADINSLIGEVIQKSGLILFFTAGKKEVHAWSLKKGELILEAAGKIHSDLKRGFIKGEVVNCKDLDSFFNLAEARSRGFVKLVDRDYVVEENDIIEIRFNV